MSKKMEIKFNDEANTSEEFLKNFTEQDNNSRQFDEIQGDLIQGDTLPQYSGQIDLILVGEALPSFTNFVTDSNTIITNNIAEVLFRSFDRECLTVLLDEKASITEVIKQTLANVPKSMIEKCAIFEKALVSLIECGAIHIVNGSVKDFINKNAATSIAENFNLESLERKNNTFDTSSENEKNYNELDTNKNDSGQVIESAQETEETIEEEYGED